MDKEINLPEGLLERVLARIQREKRLRSLKRQLVVFSMLAVGSSVAMVPSFQMVRTNFIESGFFNFLSLLFSDFKVVTASWQNFALSLLEALPLTGLIIFLGLGLVFFASVLVLTKESKIIFTVLKEGPAPQVS